ncbi:hypothetical protein FA13DRAFT_1649978 [Coprinellus micaceus]|uniref:CFEM domain-containing protein n=1 Tax=Coprinellus micaceus TaxID=71717 RepID=A0A4Y7S8A1_COPMI|nr:hypothetical protein FA13DRAFT_1649978 [Coprinellus micaceus]
MKLPIALTVTLALITSAYTQPPTPGTSTATTSEANPSSLGVTPCILACVTPAATQNGCAGTDISCLCSSSQFQVDAAACLQNHCLKTEIESALTLQEVQCGAVSISATGTPGPAQTVDFTTPTASATNVSTPPPTSKNPGEPTETSENGASGMNGGWAGALALVPGLLSAWWYWYSGEGI